MRRFDAVFSAVCICIKLKAALRREKKRERKKRASPRPCGTLCFPTIGYVEGHFYSARLMDTEALAADTLFIKLNSLWTAVCPCVLFATHLLITVNGV